MVVMDICWVGGVYIVMVVMVIFRVGGVYMVMVVMVICRVGRVYIILISVNVALVLFSVLRVVLVLIRDGPLTGSLQPGFPCDGPVQVHRYDKLKHLEKDKTTLSVTTNIRQTPTRHVIKSDEPLRGLERRFGITGQKRL